MRTMYVDCGMGAAGDMLTAALLELLPDPAGFLAELNGLGIPGVTYTAAPSQKCGIRGTQVTVTVEVIKEEGHHHHSRMRDIEGIVENLPVSDKVRGDILAVYRLIAEAESAVHGVPVTEIHFHEVGTMDAVADVTAVCLLMERLAPERVVVSPVHVGGGQVTCAHGILPVPAPATVRLLEGIPICGGPVRGELCTPTGAALLRHFAAEFGDMPVMRVSAVGYGCGKRDFEAANCVRVLLGETEDAGDVIVELCCSLDDMTAEALGYAQEQFFAAGAAEVYTTPIQMKKSRPGVLLTVMCREAEREEMIRLLFRHTTTLGVREYVSRRRTLTRRVETVATEYGPVRRKIAAGYGVTREKAEYEDVARIARESGQSFAEVKRAAGTESGKGEL